MLKKDYPELAKYWNYKRNDENGVNFEDCTPGSGKKVWWICDKGHEWEAKISNVSINKQGCPYCAGQKVLAGFNDLLSQKPDLCKEWDYEKNGSLTPDKTTIGTDKKAWWKCPKGHSYCANINSRTRLHTGCPYCANKKVLPGYNDLATTRKDLLTIWNFEKNAIKPTEVTAISGKKVWWKCLRGHEWQATIAHIAYGRGCPYCNNESSSSFPEQAIFYYLKQIDPTVLNRYKYLDKYELDIFIPDHNVGIEYDGYRWHRNEKKKKLDKKKEEALRKNGITLFRVIEIVKKEKTIDGFVYDDGRYYCNNDNPSSLNAVIADLATKIFKKQIVVNVNKDRIKIYNEYLFEEKRNSIETRKDMLEKWDKEKNINILPSSVRIYSDKRFWWKCKNGHSFMTSPHRMAGDYECPDCKKERIAKNSIVYTNPDVANEWNYEKNVGLSPNEILPNSNKRIWWKCKNNHEWEAIVCSRTRTNGRCNCPYCSGRKVLTGFNDLATTRKDLLVWWNYEKNKTIKPTNVTAGSHKKVWWKCPKGHEWEAVIYSVSGGTRCPYCAGKKEAKNE